jgi:hypothetical protein
MAPADLRKEGSAFDLPLAIGIGSVPISVSGRILLPATRRKPEFRKV